MSTAGSGGSVSGGGPVLGHRRRGPESAAIPGRRAVCPLLFLLLADRALVRQGHARRGIVHSVQAGEIRTQACAPGLARRERIAGYGRCAPTASTYNA